MKAGNILRNHFKERKILLSLGVYDALSAKIINRAGIPSIYITGYGAAASMLGVPDIGLVSESEMVNHVRCIAGAVSDCTVIADADTGYGGPANVFKTVRDYEAAGAHVIQLEDQEWPKRCGHMEGKRLVPPEEMIRRIRVALHARKSPDTLILARTDAIAVEGFEAAIRRANLYRDAGADILFVEAPVNMAQMAAIPERVEAPCLANMVEGGKTPFLDIQELEKMGYAIAIFPISTLLLAARRLTDLAQVFRMDGTSKALTSEMMTFPELNDLIGLQSYLELDKI